MNIFVIGIGYPEPRKNILIMRNIWICQGEFDLTMEMGYDIRIIEGNKDNADKRIRSFIETGA